MIDWISARLGNPQNQVMEGSLATIERAHVERMTAGRLEVRESARSSIAAVRARYTHLSFSFGRLGSLRALLIVGQAWLLVDVVVGAFSHGKDLAQLKGR